MSETTVASDSSTPVSADSSASGSTAPETIDPTTTTSEAPVASSTGAEQEALMALVDDVMRRAAEDVDFTDEIIADPRGVLIREGFTLEPDVTVRVLEPTVDSVPIVLDDRNLTMFYPEILEASPGSTNDEQQLLRDVRSQAQSDAEFKTELLDDTEATLVAAGMNPAVAGRITFVDYEPDTQFFLLLPPPNPATRMVWELVIRPLVVILRELIKQAGVAVASAVAQTARDGFWLIEAACFFPRLFGEQCGATVEQIEQFIRSELGIG